MKMKIGLLVVFCLGGWGSLCAYELDAANSPADALTELFTLDQWDNLDTCALAAKKGKKGGPKGKGKRGGSKGGKKTGAKGKKGGKGKKRCVRVIRKNGRIIRVIPCPTSGRRPKSGR